MSQLKLISTGKRTPPLRTSPSQGLSPSTPNKSLAASLALAAKPTFSQSANSAKKLLLDGFFSDALWKPQDSKMSTLDAIISMDFKTASRRDLVSIIALFKTLEKFEKDFCESWLNDFEELRLQQFDEDGDPTSRPKEKSTQVRGIRVMSKCVPFPFIEMVYVIMSKHLLMSESGLFHDLNFETNEGNLLSNDTLSEDDDNISKSGGQASLFKLDDLSSMY